MLSVPAIAWRWPLTGRQPAVRALLLLFFLGVIPYPFGLLVLLAFIVARVLYKS